MTHREDCLKGPYVVLSFLLLLFCVLYGVIVNASVNSTCAQPPPPRPPGYYGAFGRLVSPGGGAFANFALPGGRAFANARAIP